MSNATLTSNGKLWRIAPGDPTCVFAPGVAKPINCGSQKAASLIVAAVNAYCLACKGTGWIDGAPGERIPCDCRPASETSDELRWAAEFASGVLAELYAKYQTKIGPFASQAQVANGRLRAALKANES